MEKRGWREQGREAGPRHLADNRRPGALGLPKTAL